jgi:hypothetical protein
MIAVSIQRLVATKQLFAALPLAVVAAASADSKFYDPERAQGSG